MTAILVSRKFVDTFGKQLNELAQRAGFTPELVHLPDGEKARLPAADCERIEIAYFTGDLRQIPGAYDKFCDAVSAAKNLKWLHFVSAGVDQHPFVPALIQRGVTLTTSAGSNSEPVAQFAITGLLMLARQFPIWIDAQRRHAWERTRGIKAPPPDLRGQAVMVVGLGTIGSLIARFCQVLGMYVIGIRRSPRRAGETLDEIHPPAKLIGLLPRCQWLVIACPYAKETHHLIKAQAFAALPRGACIINIARGSIIEEPALIAALQSGHLGGAYLDVFEQEPLPVASPLWELSNVILTPHIGAISAGNQSRSAEMFLANLEKWTRGEAMQNEYRE